MKQKTGKKVSEYVLTLLVYLITLIAFGAYRINSILNVLDKDIVGSAKLSSYVSLVTSSVFSIIVVIVISFIAYFLIQIFDIRISTTNLINSIISSIIVLIIFELIKFGLSVVFFDKAVYQITDFNNIINSLKNSQWYYYEGIINVVMISFTGIVFGINTSLKNKNYLDITLLSMVMIVGFYISTLNVFDSI